MTAAPDYGHCDLTWARSYRIVPSRFPPVGVFDVARSARELDLLAAVEGDTNDRLTEIGRLSSSVPQEQWRFGPGTSPIMAAFSHFDEEGGRFHDGSHGAWYSARTLNTAVAESLHRLALHCRRSTNFKGITSKFERRVYITRIQGRVVDLQALPRTDPILTPDSYEASHEFTRQCRNSGESGVLYPSVRDPDGLCVAAWSPAIVVPPATPSHHLLFRWNGAEVVNDGQIQIED